MEPTLPTTGCTGEGWLWQLKWDGVRCLGVLDRGMVRLWSRRGHLLTASFPEVAAAVRQALEGQDGALDGEIVVLDPGGRPSFPLTLRRATTPAPAPALVQALPAVWAVFDILALGGRDLRPLPLGQRLAMLEESVPPGPRLHRVATNPGEGSDPLGSVARAGLEGVVFKRADSAYLSGPSALWRKVKVRRELVGAVVGYLRGASGARSLHLALGAPGAWLPLGAVSAGLDRHTARAWQRLLEDGPEGDAPPGIQPSGPRWVVPRWAARVRFHEFTSGGRLRGASLHGGPLALETTHLGLVAAEAREQLP